jgi:hypothetical protein
MKARFSFVLVCLLFSLASTLQAQQTSSCSMEQPPLRTNRTIIFSDEQEQWLGDVQARQQEPSYDLLPASESAELTRIGQKILAQLPPTPTHYTFRVYESGEPNGFSIAGGYVYISRKLITDARNEDEVAGVVAHEIGHIYTRQVAAAYTREFKSRLGVTSIVDRADLEDKMQLLNNVPWKDSAGESESEAEKDELLADRVGMYALIKAGYAPKALSENLDRITANKGHTGNIFTDILGGTSEINLRVRVARKNIASLPADCGKREPSSSPEFKIFQESIRNVTVHPLIPPTAGLNAFKLDPPIHPSLDQVRFSPDGKYLLAQTETSIHVLSRSPLKLLFSIDARAAAPAHFTADSAHIVFHYSTMRVEQWNVIAGKRESYHELIDYEGCSQTGLAPDGRTFFCLAQTRDKITLRVTDVETGNKIYEDNAFYHSPVFQQSSIIVRGRSEVRIGSFIYSQDGRTALIVCGAKTLALDLATRKPIPLSGTLSRLQDGRLVFVDSSHLLYECNNSFKEGTAADTFELCEASFPDGLFVDTFKIGYQWVEPVVKGNYVVVGPFKDSAAILTDPSTGKAVAAFKMDSLDIFGNQLAIENEAGGVTVSSLDGQHAESLLLPVDRMNDVEGAQFSHDGRFLAYSNHARSAIWDVTARKRVGMMRGFRAVRFDDDDQMYAQYPQAGTRPGQNFHIDLNTGKATAGPPYAIDQFQRTDVLVTFQPQQKSGGVDENVILQVADVATGSALWTRRYPHDTPLVREYEDGTVILQMPIEGDTAQNEMKHKPVKTSDWKNEWISHGLLVEVVDSHTGEIKHAFQAPESHNYWNGSDARRAVVYGNTMVIRGIYNNSTIYNLTDGKRLAAFYGRTLTGDGTLGLLAVTNLDQEVTVLDAQTGKRIKQVTLDEVPLSARFIPADRTLRILTASQTVYIIPVEPGVGAGK